MSRYLLDVPLPVAQSFASLRSTIDGELVVCFNNRLWSYVEQWLNQEETYALLGSLTNDRALRFGAIVWKQLNAPRT